MANNVHDIIVIDSDGEENVESTPVETTSKNETPAIEQKPQEEQSAPPEILKRIKQEPGVQQVTNNVVQEAKENESSEQQKSNNESQAPGKETQPINGQKANEALVEKVEVKDGDQQKNSLWITNLPITTKATELKALFAEYGKITSARIFTTKNASNAMCFGSVTMTNAEVALQAKMKFNKTNLNGKIILIDTVAQIPVATRPTPPVTVSQPTQEPAKSVVEPPVKVVDNTKKEEAPKVSTNEKKSSETDTKSKESSTKKNTPTSKSSKKDDDSKNKVPIKAPETSKSSSSKSNDPKHRESRIPSRQQSNSRSHRDTGRSNTNSRRPGNYKHSRSPIRSSARGRTSGRRFLERESGRQSTQYRDVPSHRPFVDSTFNRPIITTSHEPLFNQRQMLEMKMEAERAQKVRELAIERQRQQLEKEQHELRLELERAALEKQRMEIDKQKKALEMEKLKFELEQAREREKKALSSISHTTKSTVTGSNYNRDYLSSKEKERRRSPRSDPYRGISNSQRRSTRSRSPIRSSARERKPELYYDSSAHRSSSRGRKPEERSSHRSSTQIQSSSHVHSSSSSRSAVPQPSAFSGYSSSSYHTSNPTHHHPRIEQPSSKDAVYEKRLSELYRGTETVAPIAYGRTSDTYTGSSYSRSSVDTRYPTNVAAAASYQQQNYPQSYSTFSYDAHTTPTWRKNPSEYSGTANLYNEKQEYTRRF